MLLLLIKAVVMRLVRPKEYQNIQMVSLSNSSRRFRCDVVVKKSDSDPGGYVQSVSLPSGAPPDKTALALVTSLNASVITTSEEALASVVA